MVFSLSSLQMWNIVKKYENAEGVTIYIHLHPSDIRLIRSGVDIRNCSSIRSCKPNATSVHLQFRDNGLREVCDHLARFSLSTILTSLLEGPDETHSSTYSMGPVKLSQDCTSLCFQKISVISECLYFGATHYFYRSSEHPMVAWLSDRIRLVHLQ